MDDSLPCPVCKAASAQLDAVDFNKSCEEANGKFLDRTGISVQYFLCGNCGFCFAPEIAAWKLEEFEARIYNDEYVLADPEYRETRPRANAAALISLFGERARSIRHLDYGGGNGLLARVLKDSHWQSVSYDPFVDRDADIGELGQFDLITAFEVFEHVPDARQLMSNLRALLAPGGIVLFSTLLSDGNIGPRQKLGWWYAAPRNGHISLYSRKSLALLAQEHGFACGSFSAVSHVLFTQVPPWAQHFLRVG